MTLRWTPGSGAITGVPWYQVPGKPAEPLRPWGRSFPQLKSGLTSLTHSFPFLSSSHPSPLPPPTDSVVCSHVLEDVTEAYSRYQHHGVCRRAVPFTYTPGHGLFCFV